MVEFNVSSSVTYKRLVAAGNNQLFYEDISVSVGTMKQLAASAVAGQLDTSDNLNMFEAFQKVFIVNGANLKVADFINTKLTVTALTINRVPAHGDILSQVQNGGDIAYMVVDFVNTARTEIYGYAYYAGSATAFLTTKDITSNDAIGDMDPNPIPNANISAVAAKPHWYDWTPYPNITLKVAGFGEDAGYVKSFGSMPNKAYLGCLYRGRCVLSGDPEHPYQWYMARQMNPWDWAYIANDAQSPVKGGDSDAGELGDIIRTLIPYKDDYLINGCATTCWYIAGDPAEGGSINELDLTVGMFGANSWCFDGEGNLYFWGTNGIYKTTIPGTPKCISEIKLPNLVNDAIASGGVNPADHRITLAYDRVRAGILICITKLSDGSNSNYWYDLRTLDESGIGGFFPESYGDNRGAYSLFHYGANDADYRDLLVGCKDGYIRRFNKTLKSDNDSADAVGVGNVIIDSYVTFGPLQMVNDPKSTGKLTGLDCVTAGALPSGGSSDSDDITFAVWTANSAEKILELLAADTAPNIAGTIKAPGRRRGSNIKRKVKGVYAGVKLQNDTVGETWAFEQLLIDAKKSGRLK